MSKRLLSIVSLAGLWAINGCAQPTGTVAAPSKAESNDRPVLAQVVLAADATTPTAPATQPARKAMPAGHPDIAGMSKPGASAQQAQGMPPGHPDIGQMGGGAKAAAMGGAGGMSGMPPGHPDLSQMQGGAMMAPATTQPAQSATLTIRARQATVGGPNVTEGKVVVELNRPNGQRATTEAALDATGTAFIKGLPVNEPFQPVVRINYLGVEYQVTGHVVDATHATQTITVPVYETTDAAPEWQVKMRHVMVEPAGDALHIMEVVAIETPGDRAWVGVPDATGGRTTFSLPLPKGATDVKLLGGFHDCCTRIENDAITNTMAMTPGTTQYHYAYAVPVSGGSAIVPIAAPAPTNAVLAVVPEDGSTIEAQGLEFSGTKEMKLGPSRIYKAVDVAKDVPVTLSITGIPAAPAQPASFLGADAKPAASGSSQAAQVIAMIGGAMILLFGGALLFARGGKAALKKA